MPLSPKAGENLCLRSQGGEIPQLAQLDMGIKERACLGMTVPKDLYQDRHSLLIIKLKNVRYACLSALIFCELDRIG